MTNRDGGLHREQAVPLLDAGVPVWVDKPLAVTFEDAEAIIEVAWLTRTPLTSYSALRWIDTEALVERARDLGPLQSVFTTGQPIRRVPRVGSSSTASTPLTWPSGSRRDPSARFASSRAPRP